MGQLTETTVELQAILDNVDAGNAGKTVVSDQTDTSSTEAKKSGFHPLGASSSNAPNTETAVIITAARDSGSTDLRYAQVLITDSNDLFIASDSNGVKSAWSQAAMLGAPANFTTLTASGNATISRTGANALLVTATDTTTNASGIQSEISGQTWLAGVNFGATDGRWAVFDSTAAITPFWIAKTTGAATFISYIKTQSTTVAGLTAAGTAGASARSFVTDATATTFASIVAGGGANGVPVYSDGTNWRIG